MSERKKKSIIALWHQNLVESLCCFMMNNNSVQSLKIPFDFLKRSMDDVACESTVGVT